VVKLLSVRRIQRLSPFSCSGICFLIIILCLQFAPYNAQPVRAHVHIEPPAGIACSHVGFSPDGNPFPVCPGPYPIGGNCVWWAWEQWHWLGYDLPYNWGNAADWISDAERVGLAVGATPRVGSIAVFPLGDGVWAYGPAGHVAFVTAVSANDMNFNVTYQNYGDPTPMYIGMSYNVGEINQASFQGGQMRFIYFPQTIDIRRFAMLPGVGAINAAEIARTNTLLGNAGVQASNQLRVNGLTPAAGDQEFNADFSGNGLSDLLLYDRQRGSLSVLELANGRRNVRRVKPPRQAYNEGYKDPLQAPVAVPLGDKLIRAGQWGSSLDIHIGDFSGSGKSEILLYDRVSGQMHLLALKHDLTIARHIVLPGEGAGWELYVGRFDGKRSGIFMYNRFAHPVISAATIAATVTPTRFHRHSFPGVVTSSNVHHARLVQPTKHPVYVKKLDATPKVQPTPTPQPPAQPTKMPEPTREATAIPDGQQDWKDNSNALLPTMRENVSAFTRMARGVLRLFMPSEARAMKHQRFVRSSPSNDNATSGVVELSGAALQPWERQGNITNVRVLSFKKDLSIDQRQEYTLWHGNWEVYVGRFASPQRDGLFLYDRTAGEARILDFDQHFALKDYQQMHELAGNWIVYSGDFVGAGRAQLLLYDPSNGHAQIMLLARNLSLAGKESYDRWGTNRLLYIGQFGTSSLSVMLYNPQDAKSLFLAFDKSLHITHRYLAQTWDRHWQVLIGAFLDRSRCLDAGKCSTGDDILALDRRTGQMGQYIFSFGRKEVILDGPEASSMEDGAISGASIKQHLHTVDTTTFRLVSTLNTSIRSEELY
jgi:CHAP domain